MKSSLLLILALSPCTFATRNPFEPPAPSAPACEFQQADRWRYRGMVGRGDAAQAIVTTPEGKGRRLNTGEVLSVGWRITAITAAWLRVQPDAPCQAQQWKLKEQEHDKETFSGAVIVERGGKPGRTG